MYMKAHFKGQILQTIASKHAVLIGHAFEADSHKQRQTPRNTIRPLCKYHGQKLDIHFSIAQQDSVVDTELSLKLRQLFHLLSEWVAAEEKVFKTYRYATTSPPAQQTRSNIPA